MIKNILSHDDAIDIGAYGQTILSMSKVPDDSYYVKMAAALYNPSSKQWIRVYKNTVLLTKDYRGIWLLKLARNAQSIKMNIERIKIPQFIDQDPDGFDLLALMCGSEGMLGVVTEVWVKLLPLPPVKKVLLAAFADVSSAADAVGAIIAAGLIPAGLEMMDHLAIKAAEAFVHAGYPLEAEAILLCELDGVSQEVAADGDLVTRVLTSYGAFDIQVADDPQTQARLWAGRKAAFPAMGRIAPDYYCVDGTIPRHQLAGVLQQILQLGREYDLAVANVFHAGDGNLHPLILYDASIPGELAKAEAMGGRILEACIAAGGTITGEHGVGIEKLDQMCVQFNTDELDQFFRLKAAFDPQGLANPGKAIPTLTRCIEIGGMHVHKGKLPFRQLERF